MSGHLPDLKLIIIGDGGVGKTAFVKKLFSLFASPGDEMKMETEAFPGSLFEVYTMHLHTVDNKEPIKIYIGVTKREEKYRGYQDPFYTQGPFAAIIMFDVTSRITYKDLPNMYRDLTRICGNNIPIVICGNKVEIKDRKVQAKQITFHRKKKNCQYYDISVERDCNIKKPLLWLILKLMGPVKLRCYLRSTLAHFHPAPQPPSMPAFKADVERLLEKKCGVDKKQFPEEVAIRIVHYMGFKAFPENLPPLPDNGDDRDLEQLSWRQRLEQL